MLFSGRVVSPPTATLVLYYQNLRYNSGLQYLVLDTIGIIITFLFLQRNYFIFSYCCFCIVYFILFLLFGKMCNNLKPNLFNFNRFCDEFVIFILFLLGFILLVGWKTKYKMSYSCIIYIKCSIVDANLPLSFMSLYGIVP